MKKTAKEESQTKKIKQDLEKMKATLPPELSGQRPVKMWSFRFDMKKIIVWALVFFLFIPAVFSWLNGAARDASITVTQAMADIKAQKVQSVEVMGDQVILDYGETNLKFSTKKRVSPLPNF